MDSWELVKQRLATKLSAESYDNWFSASRLERAGDDTLWVSVAGEAAKRYIEQEYSSVVDAALRDLTLPVRNVRFFVAGAPESPASDPGEPAAHEVGFQRTASQLNLRFTFDSFVVGSCNQFAHAAAQAVATRPSERYNPLFIYGGVGMGKTHLMHAIGHSLLTNYPSMRIVYTSSERFMNEMIACIRLQRMIQFHRHYRSADVLLIDDIQLLSGKEATQEEFFHTFNALHEHQKQIVVSSDSPPKEIRGLVERLRSRFEWGLMVDIQPPDLETKMAILDKKADEQGMRLPEDVRVFIATKTRSNVRELEGALVKLLAYSSVTGTSITLPMAQQVLKHLVVGGHDRRVSIDGIIKAVAAEFELQPAQLKQKSNAHSISYPRQIAMYLAKELTGASLPEIGRVFSGKHHTTVLHSVKKIAALREKDPDLNRLIHKLSDSLH
jgi:chromosomal replication initiator protein